jgi:polyisoprenoid-binding protein YceI
MATATSTTLPTGTWNLDPVHSQVGFAVDYMIGTFRGTFAPVSATLVDGVLKGSAPVAGIKVQDENLETHLKSPEFFDAERAPEITFSASDAKIDGTNVVVDGELTIKGITKPVELKGSITEPIEDAYGQTRIGLKLETTVDRTDFDLNWNVPLPTGEPALKNEVTLTADLYLVKA